MTAFMTRPLVVALIEDDPGTRTHLVALLGDPTRFRCVAACAHAEEALERIPAACPDLVIVDLELPGQGGIRLLPRLRELLPAATLVVLTASSDDLRLFGALQAGADSYLVKGDVSPAELLESLEEAHAGGSPMSPAIARRVLQFFHRLPAELHRLDRLTEDERVLLDLVARGFRQKEIADQLETTARTVRNRLHRVYGKLQVNTQAEAMRIHQLARATGR